MLYCIQVRRPRSVGVPMAAIRTRRLLCAGLAGALLAAAVPAAASASTAQVGGAFLTYVGALGEANEVTIVQQTGGVHQVTDLGAVITPGPGCTAVTPQRVNCVATPPNTIGLLQVFVQDLDDSVRISGTTNSLINGGAGSDVLTGGSANDVLDAATGANERLTGGAGTDTLSAASSTGAGQLSGGPGDDTLVAPNATSSASSPPVSVLSAGAGHDVLTGQAGVDVLIGGAGPDDLTGGDAVDMVRYDDHSETLTVTMGNSATDDGGTTDEGVVNAVTRRDDVKADVELLVGGSAADNLTGTPRANAIAGGPGADTLNGGDGNDQLCGGGGPTTSTFSASIACSTPNPAGNDVLNGQAGHDFLLGGAGADTHNGGAGIDTATWADRTARVVATIADTCGPSTCAAANDGEADVNPGTPGDQSESDLVALDVENLSGGLGNDTLAGSSGANGLLGGTGADVLQGRAGDDVLCGDTSNFGFLGVAVDSGARCSGTFIAGPGNNDTLDAGPGNDLLDGERGADVMLSGDQTDTVSYVGRFNPSTASLSVTIADDCAGTPCAQANDGQIDTDQVTPGNQGEGDSVSLGTENVLGGGGNDFISGNGSPNVLTGGPGTDVLNGLLGRDVLDPGVGNTDVVNGGGGVDVASYRGHPGFGTVGVNVTIDDVADDGAAGEGDDVRTDVEGILGTDRNDTLSGPSTGTAANVLMGYGGDDVLNGFGGADSISGGLGDDDLFGGAANDFLMSADDTADATVDCGDGTGDVAQHDTTLDAPVNCETLEPLAPSAAAAASRLRAVERGAARLAAAGG
jgi:Ca2+-binding RTX toxin-like protein